MPEIRNIGVNEIGVGRVYIPPTPRWLTNPSAATPIYPPVTSQIGTPIVNIPGCVEAHKDSDKNQNLKAEDPENTVTYCDAGTPTFYPIDYDASKLTKSDPKCIGKACNAPKIGPTKPPAEPPRQTPKTDIPKTPETQPECPTEIQRLKEPVGEVIGDERVVEHRLVQNGNTFECITIKEKIDIPTQIVENIPDAGTVTATVAVAVTATTSALLAKPLADLLLRLVKPVTKKVLEKIAVLRGKKIPAQSVSARRAEQRQRNQAAKLLRSARPLKRK